MYFAASCRGARIKILQEYIAQQKPPFNSLWQFADATDKANDHLEKRIDELEATL